MKNRILCKILNTRYLIILIILIIGVTKLYSVEYLDTKGKDFYLTFLPNEHKVTVNSTDSLFIFISADVPTTGNIEYFDRSGNYYKVPFNISTPNTLFSYKLQYSKFELWGYTTDNNFGTRYNSEMVSNLSFHITSVDEITVYAHSQAKNTSDAFLVYPTDVLGKEYIVASFNSNGNYSGFTAEATPSEFAIIGTEDATNVTIKPKGSTAYNNLNTQKIKLNKGEVYLVQAKMTYPNYDVDLSGTLINSDKPVALFGGHQKTLVPYVVAGSGSRDFLCEQIPPIKTFGKDAFINPFKQPATSTSQNNDLFRIFAPLDSTEIFIDGVLVKKLNSGDFYQGVIQNPALVTSSKPFMLVVYKKTADLSGGTNLGDPFMIVIPPKEQYMKSYTTINVQSYESGSKVYTEQFITIVIPKIAINSFKLDGASVNATLFNDFPNSYYSYANIPVTDGVHRSLADSAFGIYIYGYGIANSFGYTGGMSFKPIDYQAPQIMTTDSCYSVYGIVYDSLSSDSGIMSCQSPDSSKINVSVSINSISTNSKMTGFKASLIDKKFDGSFKINAIDSLNHISTKSIEIKGFTLGINNYELIDTTLKISAKLKTGSTKCFKIPIHNYGKFEQTISNFNFKNNINFVIDPPAPIIIKPGEIDTISICFYSNRDTNIAETFSFLNDCGDEKGLIEIKINTGSDIHSPGIIAKIDPCGLDYRVFASDTADWDSGIKNIKIVETINCKVNIVKQDGYSAELTIIRNSEDKDAIFQIMFTDSVGHNTLYADTIFSSSMNISSISMNSNNENEKNFGHFEIGVLTTDYIVLFNNGLNKLLINDVYLAKNTHFMIPQNQFPLIINPKDSIKLNIYFYPTAYDTIPYRDTLEINTGCLNQKILLKGYGDALIDTLNGKCNSNIVLKANSIYYGEVSSVVYPNPFSINAIVRIEVDSKQIIKLSIINSFGEKISELNNSELEKGIYEYIFKGNDLPNGIYFYKVETSSQQIIKPIILLR